MLAKGHSEQGVVNHEMFEVVSKSLSKLSEDDINAIETYILDAKDSTEYETLKSEHITEKLTDKHGSFANNCAVCHGKNGEGSRFAPPLNTNGTLRATNPTNLISFILKGIPAANVTNKTSYIPMPSHNALLNDQQVAYLVNDLRSTWSKNTIKVTPEEVKTLRYSLIKSGDIN